MLDEISLARIICRAFLEKTMEGFKNDGKVTNGSEPGVRIALELEVQKGWNKFLLEARAVIQAVRGDEVEGE